MHKVISVVLCLVLAGCSDDNGTVADSQPPHDAQPPHPDGVATGDLAPPTDSIPGDAIPAADITLAGDCTDPGKTCFAPFVCRLNPKTGKKGCLSPAGDVPPCVGTPGGQVVPFATVYGSDLVVHWTMKQGCVAPSYAPALKPRAAEIAAAIKAWHDVSCSALCLDPPTEQSTSPDIFRGERRLHFKLDAPPQPGIPALTQVTYEMDTGRMLGAEVIIDPQQQGSVGASELLQLVGYAVGLSQAPNSADSVMKPSPSLTAPGTDDTAALCKLYAAPGFCAD